MVAFVLESVVFALIGLQLPVVLKGINAYHGSDALWYALAVVAVVVAARFVWVYPAGCLPPLLSARIRAREGNPGWRMPVVSAWAGVRGVGPLAVASSLPA